MCYPLASHITHTFLSEGFGLLLCQELREKCSILATEATSPTKLHKDISKQHSLLLMSMICLINSQTWFEDLTWGLISIHGKRNGEQKGLTCAGLVGRRAHLHLSICPQAQTTGMIGLT